MQIIFVRILIAILVLGGIGTGVAFWLKRQAAAGDDALVVRVEPVSTADLVETVSAPGQVKPRVVVPISARVAARITELPLKVGDRVTRGNPDANPPVPATLLVKLDSKDLESALESVKARYAAQEAERTVAEARIVAGEARIKAQDALLLEAQKNLRRQKQLFESRDVSEAAVDDAISKVDQLTAEIDSARKSLEADRKALLVLKHNLSAADAQIQQAKDNLSYTVITSPINGVVTKVNSEVGETVAPTINNAGTVIMEVADLSVMLVIAKVDETAVAQLERGQRATVRMTAYENQPFEGTVDTVALAATEERDGTRHYKTEILLQINGQRIPSGLSADVDVETHRHQAVMRVPTQAVLGRPVDDLPTGIRDLPDVQKAKTITPVVYRFVDGKAVATPVTIGPSDLTHTLIRSGLKAGDRVIVGPYKVLESLQHDRKVKEDAAPATRPASAPATRGNG